MSQREAGFFFRKLFVSFVNIELMWLTKTLWICFVETKDILSETLQAANINYDTLQSRDGKQAVDSQYQIPSEPPRDQFILINAGMFIWQLLVVTQCCQINDSGAFAHLSLLHTFHTENPGENNKDIDK